MGPEIMTDIYVEATDDRVAASVRLLDGEWVKVLDMQIGAAGDRLAAAAAIHAWLVAEPDDRRALAQQMRDQKAPGPGSTKGDA